MSAMHSPFEELEYLAEYLPDEGESVVVTRRQGELVCESHRQSSRGDALDDVSFLGRLVQADHRLRQLAVRPLAVSAAACLWGVFLLHQVAGLDAGAWIVDATLLMVLGVGAAVWVRSQRSRYFLTELRPMLLRQLQRRGLDKHALVGLVHRRRDLKVLATELARWID